MPVTAVATSLFTKALVNPIRPVNTDLIFFGELGRDGIRRAYECNKVWAKAKADVGITDYHFCHLSHEAVSRLVKGGFGDQEVVAISGHKSMQMLKRYTHLRAEDLVLRLDQIATASETV